MRTLGEAGLGEEGDVELNTGEMGGQACLLLPDRGAELPLPERDAEWVEGDAMLSKAGVFLVKCATSLLPSGFSTTSETTDDGVPLSMQLTCSRSSDECTL